MDGCFAFCCTVVVEVFCKKCSTSGRSFFVISLSVPKVQLQSTHAATILMVERMDECVEERIDLLK